MEAAVSVCVCECVCVCAQEPALLLAEVSPVEGEAKYKLNGNSRRVFFWDSIARVCVCVYTLT